MPRPINLRQIEALKAVIELGTVNRGAEILNISQPAMSKLIAHLEMDTGLKLFDRVRKRLVPTDHALRLHEEVGRIFSGVRQVESVIDALRREEQGRLLVGVLPALAGSFIQRVTTSFLDSRRNIYCSVRMLKSELVVEQLVARKLDVGLVNGRIDNPRVTLEPLMEHPLVCIMPHDHQLAVKSVIMPEDLQDRPFVTFDPEIYLSQLVADMLETYAVRPRMAVSANVALSICEFVAAGFGLSLVHPLMVTGLEDRLTVRSFKPDIMFEFQLCRAVESKNARFVDAFAEELRTAARRLSTAIADQV